MAFFRRMFSCCFRGPYSPGQEEALLEHGYLVRAQEERHATCPQLPLAALTGYPIPEHSPSPPPTLLQEHEGRAFGR